LDLQSLIRIILFWVVVGKGKLFWFLSWLYAMGKPNVLDRAVAFLVWNTTFGRLAQWRISEHKSVNTPQKLMRG